jgi:hypothetical protein
MDQDVLLPGKGVIAFFAALVVVACATSVTAQYCGDGSVAHAVQVKFADCGDMNDNVSVYIGSNSGSLLPLTRLPTGYWEADMPTFEPSTQTLCSHTCRGVGGCARFSEMVAVGPRRVCAARYVIRCTESVWKLHVETEPGWYLVYKRLKQTPDQTEQQRIPVPHPTPYDLCDLAYDEQVEPILQLRWIAVSIPLKPIDVRSFQRGPTVDVNRDDLAREYQAVLGTKRLLSAGELELLPKRITFKLDR